MEREQYLIGLGYGGTLKAMARFEWEFRCTLGLRDRKDAAGRDVFIREFVETVSPEVPVVLVLDDYSNPLFRTFMETGKQAITKDSDLYVFVVIEDQTQEPHVQYFLNIEQDPVDETLMPNQMLLDAEGVPDFLLLFMQDRLNVRFYRREDEVMLEFRMEELPVL
ncbi:hypothetical protein [Effusibacillus lacus]|uniref:Uncharacterized protein n=1 Tax=Effusibacillus lacus TaxID=1348429 RepID=A0A292YFH6_9BACL|nr:hypothetical protein [Effusibacillus lacus]TCS74330.1 hypothetical protein EDD64_11470 [Effusibacillus lacus]GAX88787.1 hypothetical protein EFBL_0401 [Effusibacillus lacus]